MKREIPLLDKPVKKKRILSEAEKILWHEAMQTALSLPIEELPTAPVTFSHPPSSKPKPPILSPIPAFTTYNKKITIIQAVLDLHGHTLLTAYPALYRFILNAQKDKHRHVMVITGKGKAPGYNTLRAMLPYWLQETELQKYVSNFSHAPERKGGSGAWYVTLRK